MPLLSAQLIFVNMREHLSVRPFERRQSSFKQRHFLQFPCAMFHEVKTSDWQRHTYI